MLGLLCAAAGRIQECDSPSSGKCLAIGTFTNSDGLQIYTIDCEHGCVNETLFTLDDGRVSPDGYAEQACSRDGKYLSFPIRTAGGSKFFYLNLQTRQVSYEFRGVHAEKYAWYEATNRPILVYGTGNPSTYTIGSPNGPHGGQGHIYTHFQVEHGSWKVNAIGAFHQSEHAWYVNFQDPHSDSSTIYIVGLNGSVHTVDHNLRIFDMFYSHKSQTVAVVYSKEGFDQSCGGFPSSKPSNPRTSTVYFSTVHHSGLTPLHSMTTSDCLRWHAISDVTEDSYIFYAQKDFNGQNGLDYHSGLGMSSGSHSTVGPYWGTGINNAVWGICAL
jgi:hypothetical protein